MARYIANVALSVKGSRIEKGGEFELGVADVAALDPTDFSPVSSIAEEAPQSEESVGDPNEMNLAQLKERAKALGLPATGSKADLIERITLNSGAPEADDKTEDDITND